MREPFLSSVCACLRDENPDHVIEWIEWHLSIGFEHFYVLDDRSQIPLKDVLRNYRNHVTFAQSPICPARRGVQVPFYNYCVEEFADQSRWMALFDADEFLVLKRKDLHVNGLLEDYGDCGGLVINWRTFGPNGHARSPSGLVIENYLRCRDDIHVKTILQPKYVRRVRNPHWATYKRGYFAVDTNRNIVTGPWNDRIDYRLCQLNHYFTKSLEDFVRKIRRGRADSAGLRTLREFYREHQNTTEEDRFLAQFSNELRTAIQKTSLADP